MSFELRQRKSKPKVAQRAQDEVVHKQDSAILQLQRRFGNQGTMALLNNQTPISEKLQRTLLKTEFIKEAIGTSQSDVKGGVTIPDTTYHMHHHGNNVPYQSEEFDLKSVTVTAREERAKEEPNRTDKKSWRRGKDEPFKARGPIRERHLNIEEKNGQWQKFPDRKRRLPETVERAMDSRANDLIDMINSNDLNRIAANVEPPQQQQQAEEEQQHEDYSFIDNDHEFYEQYYGHYMTEDLDNDYDYDDDYDEYDLLDDEDFYSKKSTQKQRR